MAKALIIGQGRLPVQCAKIFSQTGALLAVCSPDAPLQRWAPEVGVRHFTKSSDLQRFAKDHVFDYLFSVVNYQILKPDLLRLPRQMAINYHDGPLPRYAGVYATTWALMGGETTHGISWHVMTENVAGGDILKQVTFPVCGDDTAYKLNLKCY